MRALFVGVAVAIVTAVEVLANVLDLFDRFSWLWVTVLSANVAALLAVAYVVWRSDLSADDRLALGLTRKEADARVSSLLKAVDIRQCREIDIMGLVLRREMFKRDSEFSRWLLGCLRANQNVRVRIMLLDPRQTRLIALRERAERGRDGPGFLAASVNESLETLRDLVSAVWKEQRARRPQIVLVTDVAIQQWLLRIDDQMLAAPYLQHKTGASSPVFALKRQAGPWFDVFQEQFEKCFAMHQHNVFPLQEELERETAQL
jgi:hypothetical protein